MPTNLPAEWYLCEKRLSGAKTSEEKVELMKQLISLTPRHKGTEHLLANLRKRLSRLKDDLERKSRKSGARSQETIKKSGDILVSIIGFTQSGKSTLLKSLTNAPVEIGSNPYTTKEPATGVCFFEGVNIQFVEIPSFFHKRDMSIVHASDLILLLSNNQKDLEKLEKILRNNKLEGKHKIIFNSYSKGYAKLLGQILNDGNFIRIFTKPMGKKAGEKAIVLKKGSALRELVRKINESWINNFKFARIFDDTKFSGRQVGLEYNLKDKDVVEIHMM